MLRSRHISGSSFMNPRREGLDSSVDSWCVPAAASYAKRYDTELIPSGFLAADERTPAIALEGNKMQVRKSSITNKGFAFSPINLSFGTISSSDKTPSFLSRP
ncbi:hypothetical protein AVEN_59069-1 [Araneus ventricosus]|uniref:Uncharacterized protein n=1 Tax=Araneus ventricosus TaxID=182803 RepID=A0A4Y2SGH3_ARAVE|nr:hypothetical protein AVEN_59069-1 [Araneus ventricosus]